MSAFVKLNENIYAVTTPYKDIFTTTLVIKTDEGALLFDSASFDADIIDTVLPMLRELNIGREELKCVFISHNHADHAGGLRELLKHFPDITVYSRSETISQRCDTGAHIVRFEDGDELLPMLRAVTVQGHTADSSAVLDCRTGSLITGDCLQLYGIFGSGKWGANINFVAEHLAALDKLSAMDEVVNVYTAHDYHPYGSRYEGREAVLLALEACREPLLLAKRLIDENPDLDDEAIAELYNKEKKLPTMGAHVVTGIRKYFRQE